MQHDLGEHGRAVLRAISDRLNDGAAEVDLHEVMDDTDLDLRDVVRAAVALESDGYFSMRRNFASGATWVIAGKNFTAKAREAAGGWH